MAYLKQMHSRLWELLVRNMQAILDSYPEASGFFDKYHWKDLLDDYQGVLDRQEEFEPTDDLEQFVPMSALAVVKEPEEDGPLEMRALVFNLTDVLTTILWLISLDDEGVTSDSMVLTAEFIQDLSKRLELVQELGSDDTEKQSLNRSVNAVLFTGFLNLKHAVQDNGWPGKYLESYQDMTNTITMFIDGSKLFRIEGDSDGA